jgi:hypothetical protein
MQTKMIRTRTMNALLGATLLAAGLAASPVAACAATTPAATAMQTARVHKAVSDEQRAIDDLVKARTDLAHGWRRAALDRTEKAETVLLNAQQDGAYSAPDALKAIESADASLRQGGAHMKDASHALQHAEDALVTPGSGGGAGAPGV